MRIAVNTRLLLKGRLEGMGWFSYETLRRITRDHPEHEFIFIFDRAFDEEFVFAPNVKPVVAFPQSRHPVLWYLYFDWGVPRVLARHKADVFLSPDGFLSLRTNVPSMPVMHDLNFEHYPEYLPRINRYYYHYFFRRFARKAERIATVSEFTRKDIHKLYGVPENNIDVVYNGANELYKPLPSVEIEELRRKYTDSKPYFLFIGLLHPRKNIARLIKAYDKFRERNPEVKLMIIGEQKWWTDDIREAYENSAYRKDILLMGRLATELVHKLIPAALAMVYVPIFEGFGIPILEGFSCGVPVICSSTSSMPEVGGEAVLTVNPFEINEISAAMERIARDADLRNQLVLSGELRRQDFSWDKTAGLLWNSLEKAFPDLRKG